MATMADEPKNVTWLDVASHMVKTGNNALRFAPISNVMNIEYNAKRGTKITIGISPDNVALEFSKGTLMGGFLFVDGEAFRKAKAELLETCTEITKKGG